MPYFSAHSTLDFRASEGSKTTSVSGSSTCLILQHRVHRILGFQKEVKQIQQVLAAHAYFSAQRRRILGLQMEVKQLQ